MIAPMPFNINWLRPEWLVLVTIYWVAFMPTRVGVLTAFSMGLCLDLLTSMVLGKTALALAIVAYLTSVLRQRIRLFQFPNQLMIVFVLVGFYQVIHLWIQMIIGSAPMNLLFWIPTLVTTFIAAPVFTVLQGVQRSMQLN